MENLICPNCLKDFGVKYGMTGTNVESCVSCGDAFTVMYVAGFTDGRRAAIKERGDKPTVVCLCGSTRFFKEFMLANYNETMAGRIVLSVGFYPHSSQEAHGEHIGISAADKIKLDELHKRKIDLADEILVINVGGYIGESTASEIEYAQRNGKRVRYLETVAAQKLAV